MVVGQQIQGFSRSPGIYGQRWRAASGEGDRYLLEADAQSNGMCPHCDQSGQLNCLPPKGPFLQWQACAQWGPHHTDTLRISAGGSRGGCMRVVVKEGGVHVHRGIGGL